MNNNELLKELYFEQKETNRQMEKLGVITLMGILTYIGKNAKDEDSKRLCRIAMSLTVIANAMIMVKGIVERRRE